jgi:hypothetical protein
LNVPFGYDPGQAVEVLSNSRALKGFEAMGHQSKAIADSQADAPLPQIQREHARPYCHEL